MCSSDLDLANAWPEKISFQRGGLISACIALVMTPWNLFNSPFIINVFLAALGAVLGPLFDIIIAQNICQAFVALVKCCHMPGFGDFVCSSQTDNVLIKLLVGYL